MSHSFEELDFFFPLSYEGRSWCLTTKAEKTDQSGVKCGHGNEPGQSAAKKELSHRKKKMYLLGSHYSFLAFSMETTSNNMHIVCGHEHKTAKEQKT